MTTRLKILAQGSLGLVLCSLAAFAATSKLDTFQGCGLAGSAKSQCGQSLNKLKNRHASPKSATINHDITLEAILAEGDDLERWSTKDAAEIVGYVAKVQPGGRQETCNCESKTMQDIHINLVLGPQDANNPERYFVVEITPRLQSLHPTWTYKEIRKLEKKWVKFTGWMLFDTMHSRESHNTKDRPHQGCGSLTVKEIWRATAWEIHPVTKFQVVAAP